MLTRSSVPSPNGTIIVGRNPAPIKLYDASNNVISSEGDNGYYEYVNDRYHLTTAGIVYTYGSSYTAISSGSDLLSFINTGSGIGVLTCDITYDMPTLGITCSTAVFVGTLDGNGYTITMTSPAGASTVSLNTSYATQLGESTVSGGLFNSSEYRGYGYMGMITGVIDGGTIKNCNFVWNSSLSAASERTSDGNTLKYNPNNTKYFYLNKNDKNKIIITLENRFYIKKDFSLFSLNYFNHKKSYVPKSILELKNLAFYKSIYPQLLGGLNTTTNRTSENKSIGKSSNKSSNKSQNKAKNIEHIDKLLLLEKRRIAKNEKIKEELEDKKIKECTFKPKINLECPLYLNLTKEKYKKFLSKKNTDNKKMNRIEEMYEQGKQTVKSRKNRSKIEIEIEQQLHECTFHPQLQTFQNKKQEKVKFKNDIYNEKQYISLYERLKKGRLNQLVKESNNDRYELNDQLKKFIKDSKKYNLLNSQNYYSKTLPHYYNNNTMYIDDNPSTQENMNENCNLYIDINNSDKKSNNNKIEHNNEPLINNDNNNNNNSVINSSDKKNPENKEPLFIIDVNIEEGLTKKIYIFEGDTPKILAQKFCKENKLDIETQNKLENIINNQMKNPLGKIDEENFSSSDKN